MAMFLTILLISLPVLVFTCVFVAAEKRREEDRALAAPAPRPEAEAPRFFAADVPAITTRPQVPIEVLMSQIERHVRLEQAAARTFLAVPTPESLHSRTESPLVH